jgi:hypothetical protein
MTITFRTDDILNILTIYKDVIKNLVFGELVIYYAGNYITWLAFEDCEYIDQYHLVKKYVTLGKNTYILKIITSKKDTQLNILTKKTFDDEAVSIYRAFNFPMMSISQVYDSIVQQIKDDKYVSNNIPSLKINAINNVLVAYIHNFKCVRVYHHDLVDINIICP